MYIMYYEVTAGHTVLSHQDSPRHTRLHSRHEKTHTPAQWCSFSFRWKYQLSPFFM